jgi:glycosyltransferase involved in cell wall biosynthesis
MPILFVTNYLTPNQSALFSRKSDVVITYSQLDARRQWAPLTAEARLMDVSRLRRRERFRRISREINSSLNGVLIGGSTRAPEFWFSIALCRLRDIPFAIWLERPRDPLTWGSRTVLRLALGKLGGILGIGTIATLTYRQSIRGVRVRNFPYSYGRNVPHSSRLEEIQAPTAHEGTTALFIGTEWERKGLDILLTAIALMPRTLQSCLSLQVAGLDAAPPELVRHLPIEPSVQVTYLGFLQPEAIQHELSSVDVLVVPSRYDGWAVVVEEAMAVGTPVIASDEVGAAVDLVVNGYSGFVFPSEDCEALAAALSEVVSRDASDRSLDDGALTIVTRYHNTYNIDTLERAICGNIDSV